MSGNPPAGAQSASESEARGEAERAGLPFLLYRDGEDKEQRFSFVPDLVEASVGRGRSPDITLAWDDQVSRLHARFERSEEGWAIVDDGMSSNGTFVNGERVSGRRRLVDGDAVRFGTTVMTFRDPGAEEPPGQAPAAGGAPAGVELSTTQRRVLVALCRPYKEGAIASPATDEQIAEELFLTVGVVRTHLRILIAKLGVEQLPQDEKRAGLVEQAFGTGTISESDL